MDSYPRAAGRVVYVVACAALPARAIGELVRLLQDRDWVVCVVATPRAASWMDVTGLAALTGYPVRSDYKHPDAPDVLPRPDVVAVVPATFNTVNKWAAGISDTLALGILNEALGAGLPVVVCPCVKPPLSDHPAFARSVAFLRDCGVRLTPTDAVRPDDEGPYRWEVIVDAVTASVQ